MLKESELRCSRTSFWLRHHITFMPQCSPGDTLLSRLTNVLNKRSLSVADMLRVKGAEDEKRTRKALRDVGKGTGLKVETATADVEQHRKQTVTDYLFGMAVYLNTLAVARCTTPQAGIPKDLAGALVVEEEEGGPTDFMEFRYQFTLKYVDRATRYANKVPAQDAFRLLRIRDEEERTKWLHEFRRIESKSLGKVVEKIYQDQDFLWRWENLEPGVERRGRNSETDTGGGHVRQLEHTIKQLRDNNSKLKASEGRARRGRSRSRRGGGSDGGDRRSSASQGSGKKNAPKAQPITNAALKDGIVLCAGWNKGNCSKSNCPDKHACNGQDKKDPTRCCGSPGHTSKMCRSCKIDGASRR